MVFAALAAGCLAVSHIPLGLGLHPATRAAWTGVLSESQMETGEKPPASRQVFRPDGVPASMPGPVGEDVLLKLFR